MGSKLVLEQGRDFFTSRDLYEKTASCLGQRLSQADSLVLTKPIKVYRLKPALLAFLANRGIKQHPRPDGVFTLCDENPQNIVPGWAPSNYWNFEQPKDGQILRLALTLKFNLEQKGSGIIVMPATSAGIVSPADHLPNLRMLQAMVKYDEHVPSIAKKLAEIEKGYFLVSWKELKLEGLRTLDDLFREFAGNNEAIRLLANHRTVFDPLPDYNCCALTQYIVKEVQEKILAQWRKQLVTYIKQLAG